MIEKINSNSVDIVTNSASNDVIDEQVEVPTTGIGRRFDQVAAELFADYSRSRLQQWIKQGVLQVDGHIQVPKYKLQGGEVLSLRTTLVPEGDWQAEDIPLDIVFEDEHILVLNKSANGIFRRDRDNSDVWSAWQEIYHTGSTFDGIKFPATQVPSADANTLDDYEEGTWTPACAVGLTVTYGRYTKIGNRVVFNFEATITTNANAGNMSITGLPFAAVGEGSATFGYTTATVSSPILLIQSSTIYMYTGGSATMKFSNYSNKIVRITGSYQA